MYRKLRSRLIVVQIKLLMLRLLPNKYREKKATKLDKEVLDIFKEVNKAIEERNLVER